MLSVSVVMETWFCLHHASGKCNQARLTEQAHRGLSLQVLATNLKPHMACQPKDLLAFCSDGSKPFLLSAASVLELMAEHVCSLEGHIFSCRIAASAAGLGYVIASSALDARAPHICLHPHLICPPRTTSKTVNINSETACSIGISKSISAFTAGQAAEQHRVAD